MPTTQCIYKLSMTGEKRQVHSNEKFSNDVNILHGKNDPSLLLKSDCHFLKILLIGTVMGTFFLLLTWSNDLGSFEKREHQLKSYFYQIGLYRKEPVTSQLVKQPNMNLAVFILNGNIRTNPIHT